MTILPRFDNNGGTLDLQGDTRLEAGYYQTLAAAVATFGNAAFYASLINVSGGTMYLNGGTITTPDGVAGSSVRFSNANFFANGTINGSVRSYGQNTTITLTGNFVVANARFDIDNGTTLNIAGFTLTAHQGAIDTDVIINLQGGTIDSIGNGPTGGRIFF